ncbi:aldehyde-activating protein [Altererythrobacter marinus]|uniref:Aldehyde-activating protein n=1 Tax=Pelagerythrobacter marinus TaxID=538382 RepID=A0ABW9USD6_9SPHN|nr:aldehyde-activating protein [Pelagerythrobacter marinus]MXO67510.1 aldehyde-activating protein [Pelagerythrobacter marinus]
MIGHCLCRRVRIEVPGPPDRVGICNCRLCRCSGAAWGYYDPAAVRVDGAVADYRREDLDDPWLVLHFCPRCGSATHYTASAAHALDRIGVNTRLFVQDELDGVEVTYQDGRCVFEADDAFIETGTGRIGDGKAF